MKKFRLISITSIIFLSLIAQTTATKAFETTPRAWFPIYDNYVTPYRSSWRSNPYSWIYRNNPNYSYEYGYGLQRRYLRGYCQNCARNQPSTSPCPAMER